ncbi:SDR family NAD(P)-dependent oxidoreductase, partial [Streptomyces sp. NPDC053367]|uniref:SDR family NAD(P)-dependent oxidoreductase n=1 Tax=Streptomyces sp. NPDC053367 TaxID=3365700 RepID=UPI0037D286F4
PWPTTHHPRRAAISSFGISGTNAHLILEQAPDDSDLRRPTPDDGRPLPWVVSAASEAALRDQARALLEHVGERADLSCTDLAHALVTTRALHPHRAVLVGARRADFEAQLRALAEGGEGGEAAGRTVTGRASGGAKVVFVFPGQGSQWAGMARELLDTAPVFAARMRECAQALAPYTDWSLLDVVGEAPDAPSLDRVDVVQPVLFAVMVSLAALWRSAGVEPDAVVGHSQGEIAAACVAGALSLEDAARVVALRSRALTALSGGGGMASVPLAEEDVAARIAPYGGRLSVATVNGPAATTVAGEPAALDALTAELAARGVEVRRIPVDYASHSRQVEVIEAELLRLLDGIAPRTARVPFHSSVTGEEVDTAGLDAAYWYRNLRQTVRFAPTVRSLLRTGHRLFVEVSPHPVLAAAIEDTIGAEGTRAAAAVGTLRREDGGWTRFLTSVGRAHVEGADVDWQALLPTAVRRIPADLPTYRFQRERHWLTESARADVTSAGLSDAGHPLLGARTELADGRGMLFTGLLTAQALTPVLGEPAPDGAVLSAGLVTELVLHAADQAGCGGVEELTLHALPQAPAGQDALGLQVAVGPTDDEGRREVSVHGRAAEGPWRRLASGTLRDTAPAPGARLSADAPWPPAGARPVGLDGPDDSGADRVLCGLWRAGEEVYAELEPAAAEPDDADAPDGGLLPPLLLDAVVRALECVAGPVRAASWSGVRLDARPAGTLRVRIAPAGPDGYAVAMTGPAGEPVLSVAALRVSRDPALTGTTGAGDGLLRVGWEPAAARPQGRPRSCAVLGPDPLGLAADAAVVTADDPRELVAVRPDVVLVQLPSGAPADDPAEATHRRVADVLGLLRSWLAHGTESRLVFVTRGAVAADPGDPVDDLPGAAVWGLVRSAQSEHPGRFALLDADAEADPGAVLAAAGLDEPQLALRGGGLLVPRLRRDTRPAAPAPAPKDGTVLVTGGTGTLGRLVARRLATRHGVRHLLLAGRRGPDAEGVAELVAELAESGTRVSVARCDTADPEQLAALLAAVPAEAPLTGVVHAAGVLDDATVEALDAGQVRAVLRPKADAAWHLHRLTAGLDLSFFVLFSSVVGTVGAPGQANYAAANAFLDGLAAHRRAQGLPGTSVVWGPWAERSGMTRHLSDADLGRLAGSGVAPLSTERALALFDAVLAGTRTQPVAAELDLAALRERAGAGDVPPLFRALVRPRVRRPAGERQAGQEGFAARLAELTPAEREREVLELVRSYAAAALGRAEPVDPQRPFKELGFDSLTAVELRNRLAARTGLKLPTTVVFGHPTAALLAEHLRQLLLPDEPTGAAAVLAELDRLEAVMAANPPTGHEETDRERITTRLRHLLANLNDPQQPRGNLGDSIRSATTEEILALIDSRNH